jgi:hypothetical protein
MSAIAVVFLRSAIRDLLIYGRATRANRVTIERCESRS